MQLASASPPIEVIREIADIPIGFELRFKKEGGVGIFAKQDFKKDSIIYSIEYQEIPAHAQVLLGTPIGELLIEPKVHCVKQNNGMYEYYRIDSFLNHSCNANTIAEIFPQNALKNRYARRAVRNIAAGDEITVNYLYFDWESELPKFACLCSAINCFGFIGGFKDLDFDTQLLHLEFVEDFVLREFVNAAKDRLNQVNLSEAIRRRIAAIR